MTEQNSFLRRITLKLSTDLSEEEIRKAISEVMDVPIEQMPALNFDVEKNRIRNEFEKVQAIVKDHKSKLDASSNVNHHKYEELYDVGRFILARNDKFAIKVTDKILKFPDFVISVKDQKIGLEHTRLMSEERKAIFETLKHIIKKAEEKISRELAHLSKTVNIFINYAANTFDGNSLLETKFNRKEKNKIIETIADFVRSELTGGSASQPPFIRRIKITNNQDSRVDLELAESYLTIQEFSDLLSERIEKKEARARHYRSETGLSEIWLLIVIDDVNSFSGFDIMTVKLPQIQSSSFDSIFLFEKFGGKIYSLFPSI